MNEIRHLSMDELKDGLTHIRQAPTDHGPLVMIVRRPEIGAREVLARGELNTVEGLAGDGWARRKGSLMPGNLPNPDAQLTLMNTRAAALVAQDEARWAMAGDQLYVDLDLSLENLPAGTRLAIGQAVVEITALPHTGCEQFKQRFGLDALRFVNSPEGKELRLRGVNAKVITAGVVQTGDWVQKID